MLVSELKKVIDIDSRITSLHQELAMLYSERQKYIQQNGTQKYLNSPTSAAPSKSIKADSKWAKSAHAHLASSWAVYDIKVPSFRPMKKWLLRAHEVIEDAGSQRTELSGKLGLLLVPPTQVLGQPGDKQLRKHQSFITLDDYVNSDLIKRYQQKKWRLMVVYQDETPLDIGKAKDILAEKKYQLGEHDARALGVYEYYALSLQSPIALDKQTWTLLLKGTSVNSKTVPSVTFINGQYRFEIDDTDGVFGDERFRPAIEVATL